MAFRLVDTHCHVQLAAFADDAEKVIARAASDQIGLLVVGTNTATSESAVRLAEAHPDGMWAAIGVHPNHLHRPHHDPSELSTPPTEDRFDSAVLARLARSKKVVAVGETGLDYYRIAPDDMRTVEEIMGIQRDSFVSHIRFARERSLPLIVHVRDAHAHAISILKDEIAASGPLTGVIHCFSGSVQDALSYVGLGFHISFTGTVTYPPRKGEGPYNPILDVVRAVPRERILVETDSPYLAPVPERGTRNEPSNVALVAVAVAEARGVDVLDIEAQTTANAYALFNLARCE